MNSSIVRRNARSFAPALVAAALVAPQAIRAEELGPQDFARKREVIVDTPGALQTLLLDEDVYRTVRDPDFSDLRIFDAQGRALPHAIRSIAPAWKKAEGAFPLPFYRFEDLPQQTPFALGDDSDERRSLWLDFRIEARIREHDTRIVIEAPAPPALPKNAPPDPPSALRFSGQGRNFNGYLIDRGEDPAPIAALELRFAPGEDFVRELRVESGADLQAFRTLERRVLVARLESQGFRILRSRIEIRGCRDEESAQARSLCGDRFLRLRWDPAEPPLVLAGVNAWPSASRVEAPDAELRVLGANAPEDERSLLFDLGGRFPLRSAQVDVAYRGGVVAATLSGAPEAAGPWRILDEALLFRLPTGLHAPLDGAASDAPQGSEEFASDPIRLDARERHLKLTVGAQGGGLAAIERAIRVRWQPEQLLFTAGGPGNYTLAYGRHATAPARFSAEDLARIAGQKLGDLPFASVRIGPPEDAAGARAFEPRPEPRSPRAIALWTLLGALVLLIFTLALRVAREMRANAPPPDKA